MNEKDAIRWGTIFQLSMMACFFASMMFYGDKVQWKSPWLLFSHAGLILFTGCLFMLYILGAAKKSARLLTGGAFKYTRHPMYTGLFLMNLAFWLPRPVSGELLFFTLQTLFVVGLVVAAWFQEQETLARFGVAAKEYYRRTPRFFFLYPWTRAHDPH